MSQSITKVCEQLIEIKDQFEENEDLVEAVFGNDNAEDLLIAIGMAVAYLVKISMQNNAPIYFSSPF